MSACYKFIKIHTADKFWLQRIFYFYLYHAESCGNVHVQTPSQLELELLYFPQPLDPTLQAQQSTEQQEGG